MIRVACKTCKYWKQEEENHGRCARMLLLAESGHLMGLKEEVAVIQPASMENNNPSTWADFSCNMFESRQP